jgi:hypothetical protein
MSGQLQIQLTATAEATYSRCSGEAEECIARGDECNPKVKVFQTLKDALTERRGWPATTIPCSAGTAGRV